MKTVYKQFHIAQFGKLIADLYFRFTIFFTIHNLIKYEMKLLAALLLSIILLACSQKKDDVLPESTEAEISFDLNDSHYTYTGQRQDFYTGLGTYGLKNATPVNKYFFRGYSSDANRIDLNIFTNTDTLKTISYHLAYTSGSQLYVNGELYAQGINDYIDVNIVAYQNGKVSGTFSGQVSKLLAGGTQGIITNGKIKNVKIDYQ